MIEVFLNENRINKFLEAEFKLNIDQKYRSNKLK